jgi:hypothetical protein
MKSKLIRDFIYVDTDTLYSLYSQVFEGVAQTIVDTNLDQNRKTDKDKKLDDEVVKASLRSENIVLFDHMYNRLEEEVASEIVSADDLTLDDLKSKLKGTFLIKVKGNAEIEDFERQSHFLKKFNSLMKTIAYMNVQSDPELSDILRKHKVLAELKSQLPGTKGAQRAQIQGKIATVNSWMEPNELVQLVQDGAGLGFDQQTLEYFSEWIETFYKDGYEINVLPPAFEGEIAFRGIVNRAHLRVDPSYLRSLFGNFIDDDWIMVGQVTYLPGTNLPEPKAAGPGPLPEEEPSSVEANENEDNARGEQNLEDPSTLPPDQPEEPSDELPDEVPVTTPNVIERMRQANMGPDGPVFLRDPVREMARHSGKFDKIFFESEARQEVLIRPLAIYREFRIPSRESK